ncbi:MAG: hypothetical protein IPL78_11330 [Chloroflexi bacterium]|nr:hypothetical protein [Chloroflexota bacterium]
MIPALVVVAKSIKKCCLAKDKLARAESVTADAYSDSLEAVTPLGSSEPEPILTPNPLGDLTPTLEVDPVIERINTFWDEFTDAPYEEQWSLATKMLAEEPELCDGEMVFEIANTLFGQAIARGEIERYQQFLDQLAVATPEAYAEELANILDWRIQIALIEDDESNIERCFFQLSPLAGDKLDLYYRVVSGLAYHGKQEVLYQGMRQARPYVAEGAGLVEWAYSEFTEKLGDIEIGYLLDKNPNLTSDDVTLQQHFAEYELTVVPEMFSSRLDYRTGRQTPSWTLADFEIPEWKKEHPAQARYAFLLAAFTHYAHHVEGVALTKAEMAHDELARYLTLRRKGELGEPRPRHNHRQKHSRKQQIKPGLSSHPLCPDAETLDKYLAQLMGFMSFKYYETFALYELIPVWLRFLTHYNLLDEETGQQAVAELSYIKGHLMQIAEQQLSNPAVKENLLGWPYEPPKETSP